MYGLPGVVAALGAVIGLLSAGEVRPIVTALTVTFVVLGFVVPPAVDRLRERHQRLSELSTRREAEFREHFEPRARGVLPTHVRGGSYFTGRRPVLAALDSWLRDGGADTRARMVTGNPGSGKSAVLGRLAVLHRGSVVTVHARGRTPDEVADEIAAGVGLPAAGAAGLLAALRTARRRRTVIVDAVDEAVRPLQLIQDLLEPLAASADLTELRCVFGSRRGGNESLLRAFGGAVTVIDLDAAEYFDTADVAAYVRSTLLAEADPAVRTPYRACPDLAGTVADAVASRAGASFLVAQLTALALMAADGPVDATDAGTAESFPASVGAAMDRYLRQVEPDRETTRDLLTALAWTEGQGLTDLVTWAALATSLGTAVYTEQDVTRVLRSPAADLVVRHDTGGEVTARLFHEALAEHLRAESRRLRPATEIQRRIAGVLIDRVPPAAGGERDFLAADAYTRRHLATHAAAGQCVDDVLADAGYLAIADAARLLPAIAAATTPQGQRRARMLERVGQQLLLTVPQERVSYLEMAARMAGDDDLAARFGRLDPERPWRATWTRWVDLDDSRVLGHHDGYVLNVQLVETSLGTIVLAAGTWAVRGWWLRDGTPAPAGIGHPHAPIVHMVAYRDGDEVVVLTAHADGEVRRAALFAGTPSRTLIQHGESSGLACVTHAGRHVMLLSPDDRLTAFDAEHGDRCPWPPLDLNGRRVLDVASVGGRPLVALGYPEAAGTDGPVARDDLAVEVRDLETGAIVGSPLYPARDVPGWWPDAGIWSAALASVDGQVTVLVGGSIGGQVLRWRPGSGASATDEGFSDHAGALSAGLAAGASTFMAIGDSLGDLHVRSADDAGWRRLAIHDGGVAVLAVTHVGDEPVVVTGGRDGTVRLVYPSRTRTRPAAAEYRRIRHAAAVHDCPPLLLFDDGTGRWTVLDARTGATLDEHTPDPALPLRDLTFVPGDRPMIVALHGDDLVTVRPALESAAVRRLSIPAADWCAVRPLAGRPDVVLAATSDGAVAVIDTVSGAEVRPRVQCHGTFFSLVPDPAPPGGAIRFVTAVDVPAPEVVRWTLGDDGTVAGAPLRLLEIPDTLEETYAVWEFAYGRHDGRRIIAGAGFSSCFQIWDADTGEPLYANRLANAYNMAINAVELGSAHLFTGGHTCTLGIVSLDTHEERHLWVGSHLWSITALSDRVVVVGGVRGIMGVEFREGWPPP